MPFQVDDFVRKDDRNFSRMVAILLADVADTLGNRGVTPPSLGARNKLDRVPARSQV
jgi:hypothetical protein